MSSQEVCDYVSERLNANYSKLSQICEELFMHCLAPNSYGDGTGCDNMTCIIVTFSPFRKGSFCNSPSLPLAQHQASGLKRSHENGSSSVNSKTEDSIKRHADSSKIEFKTVSVEQQQSNPDDSGNITKKLKQETEDRDLEKGHVIAEKAS